MESPVGVQVGSADQGAHPLLRLLILHLHHHHLHQADLGMVRTIPTNLLVRLLGYVWRKFLRCLVVQVGVLAGAGCREGLENQGSIAVTNKLVSVQRCVAKLIIGSLSSTAGNVMDVHANLLPVDILFHKILFRAATHIASLPATHPLHHLSCKAASNYIKHHRSPLHNLFFTTKVSPLEVETVVAT